MASSINIDSLKATTYETIKKDDAFISFLTEDLSPNFQCIIDMLKKEMNSIEITLTKDNIKIIEQLRGKKLAIIPGNIKVAELRTAIGNPLWDDKKSALWGVKSKEIFGEANKEVLRYNDISVFLSQKGKKIFTNPKSINNEDIKDSISEFFESLNQLKDKEKCDELTRVFECFNKIIQKKGEVSNDAINIQLIHIEQIVRHIAIHFIKNILSTKPSSIKDKIIVNGAYYNNTEKLLKYSEECTFSNINNTIIVFLSGRNIICDYLDILRIQRNILAHISSNVTETEDRIVFAKFVLFTLLGSFYICRRNLINQAAYNKTECNEKTFSVYFNSKLNDDIAGLPENEKQSIISSLPDIKLYQEFEVNPKNKYSSHIEYTILKNEKYRLEFGEGASKVSVDVPTESFWLSPSNKPIAIWTGVKTYFFSDISTIYSELDPYIHNANKEEINALNSLVTTLNLLINDLSNKTEANSSMINYLVEATKSIEESLKNLNTKVGVISKDVKSILSAVKNILFTAKILIGILCVIIVIVFSFFMYKELSHDPNPESFIEKGDRYLKDYKPEKAGEAYRKAIAGYEALLKTDSNNINANIGLATMLMRGKGKYDLERAEQCVKRVSRKSKRGEGLYLYLLVCNGKADIANKLIVSMDSTEMTDEYTKLANAMITIYGYAGRERTINNTRKAVEEIEQLGVQEAILEAARIAMCGIDRENIEDAYYINPDPVLGGALLNTLAIDSLNPFAMALMSDFYAGMEDKVPSIEYAYAAYKCGIRDCAPILRIRILESIDLNNSTDKIKEIWEEIGRESRQQGTINAAISNYVQEYFNYEKGRVTDKQLLNSLEELIATISKDSTDVYETFLNNLYKMRVSQSLRCEELDKAIKYAMDIDKFKDSIAVSNYLLGISYAKGYGHLQKDSIKSDSLIYEASLRGYPEAAYTMLRKAQPLTLEIKKYRNQWTRSRSLTCSKDRELNTKRAIALHKSTLQNKKTTQFTIIEVPGTITYIDGIPLISEDSDGIKTYYLFEYTASEYASIPDSIWQASPKLAMEMADYWEEFYRPKYFNESPFNKDSPYIPFCPKEYQTMYNTLITCYEYRIAPDGKRYENALYNKDLPKAIIEEQLFWLQVRISSAILDGKGQIAKHLITMWLTLAKQIDTSSKMHLPIELYEQFALPEYKDTKSFVPYMKMDYPVYAY